MKISRSWHYKFVYKFWGLKEKPSEDLCVYFWKLVGLLVATSFIFTTTVIAWAIGWFLGYWPNFGKYRENNDSPWHTKYKFDGRRTWPVAPWQVVLSLGFLFGMAYWAYVDLASFLVSWKWIGIIIAGSVALVTLLWLIIRWRKTETWRLCSSYIAAKKKKVCPLVTFTGEEDGTKSDKGGTKYTPGSHVYPI